MGLIESITKLDRNFGWSFLGFVLATAFGALSLYTEFFKEMTPRLEFELLSNAPVLDVREKLPDLEVLYQSQDIEKSGKTLSVLLVRAVNRGSADLLSSHYDVKAPVGLELTGGTLVRADLSEASNEYLRKAAGVTAKGYAVILEPVIIERDEWLILKLLVLHNIGSQPTISAHGKIAGMHSIPVVPPITASENEGFWHKAFSGDVWTQLVRVPTYFIAALLIVLAIMIPSSAISDAMRSRARRTLITRFKERTKLILTDSDEFIFDGFMRSGLQYVQRLTNAVADPERLQKRVARYLDESKRGQQESEVCYPDDIVLTEAAAHPRFYIPGRLADVSPMVKNGFVAEKDGMWLPVPERLKVATSFIEYVELVGGTT